MAISLCLEVKGFKTVLKANVCQTQSIVIYNSIMGKQCLFYPSWPKAQRNKNLLPTSSKTPNRGGILFHQMPHCKHKENGIEEGRNEGGWKEKPSHHPVLGHPPFSCWDQVEYPNDHEHTIPTTQLTYSGISRQQEVSL